MSYFLLKTEPAAFSIDDFERVGTTSWGGVRNYQARNIIRDDMKVGDKCLMYHSSCAVPAAVGVGEIVAAAYPDPLQFDQKSEYYDGGSPIISPRWCAVDVKFVEKFERIVTLAEMKKIPELTDMRLFARGNRLSVFPIDKVHYDVITWLAHQ